MLYLLSALSVMYILLMYYISLLLLPPDGFVLCYIGLLVLTLWRFDDDVISPSPGKGRLQFSFTSTSGCALLAVSGVVEVVRAILMQRTVVEDGGTRWYGVSSFSLIRFRCRQRHDEEVAAILESRRRLG